MATGENNMTNEAPMSRSERHNVRHLHFVIASPFCFRSLSFQCVRLSLLCLGLLTLCGAGCPQLLQRYTNPLPRVLPPSPTLEQVIAVVNANSSQIRSFSTNRASISGSGFPSLPADIAFERPQRLRLRAGTGMTGTEFDLGSNDDRFWFWVKRNQPPAMYFCRHELFPTSPARQMIPFDPGWLVEALGVTEIDPSLPHQGPTALPNDRLRIDTILNRPDGLVTKVTILDGSQGWILEQHLYDARRQLLASSIASQHRVDPLSGRVMPTVVNIRCPPAQLEMRIDLGNVEINRATGDPSQLWAMPNYPGVPLVDLADPRNFPPANSAPVAQSGQRALPASNWLRQPR